MSNTLKAFFGIILAAVITVIAEQYITSLNLFQPKDETKTTEKITGESSAVLENSSSALSPIDEEGETNKDKTEGKKDVIDLTDVSVNAPIISSQKLKVSSNKSIKAMHIYTKKQPTSDKYMKTFTFDKKIPNYSKFIDVAFLLEEKDLCEEILFLAIEAKDKTKDVVKRNFYEPQLGVNLLRLPNKIGSGKHEVSVGYILKKEASKSKVNFYRKVCKITVE